MYKVFYRGHEYDMYLGPLWFECYSIGEYSVRPAPRSLGNEHTSFDSFIGRGLPLHVHRRLTSSSPMCARPFKLKSSNRHSLS